MSNLFIIRVTSADGSVGYVRNDAILPATLCVWGSVWEARAVAHAYNAVSLSGGFGAVYTALEFDQLTIPELDALIREHGGAADGHIFA